MRVCPDIHEECGQVLSECVIETLPLECLLSIYYKDTIWNSFIIPSRIFTKLPLLGDLTPAMNMHKTYISWVFHKLLVDVYAIHDLLGQHQHIIAYAFLFRAVLFYFVLSGCFWHLLGDVIEMCKAMKQPVESWVGFLNRLFVPKIFSCPVCLIWFYYNIPWIIDGWDFLWIILYKTSPQGSKSILTWFL